MIDFLNRSWRDASLAKKGGAVILFMLMAMALAAAVGVRDAIANMNGRIDVSNSIAARGAINGALSNVSLAAAEHYNYLLSGREQDASGNEEHLAAAADELRALDDFVVSDSEQLNRAQEARSGLEELADLFEEQQLLARTQGVFPSDLPPGQLSRTDEAANAMIARLQEMRRAEQVTLDARRQAASRSRNRVNVAFALSIFAGIAGGIFIGIVFTRGVVGRIKLIGDYAVEQARGNTDAVLADQGKDELGILARRLRDATELAQRRDAEAKESRARLQSIMDHMTSMVYVKSMEGKYIFANKAFEAVNTPLYGNVLGKTNFDFLREEEARAIEEVERRVMVQCHPVEEEETYTLPDGERTFITVRFCLPDADGKPHALCGISTDITERKLAVIALKRAKEELEQRVRERTAELAAVNDALRIENQEHARANAKIDHQLQRMHLLNQIAKGISARHDLASLFNVVLLNLTNHLSIDAGVVFFFEEASNILLVGAHAEADEELARCMKFENGQVLSVGENGLRRCVGGATIHQAAVSESDPGVIGMMAQCGIGSVVAAPLRASDETLGVLLVGRRAAQSFSSGECEFLTQLGDHVALALTQIRLLDRLKRAFDDLKLTQHHMAQQERLRAMGQMASGIAHDINNTLGPITLYCELLLQDARLDETARGYIRTIFTASENVAKTVAGLRHFYRPAEDTVLLDRVNLNLLVRAVVDLTKPRWSDMSHGTGKTIEVKMELSPDDPVIQGSESDLRNVLTNLIFNAVDAMPEGGPLTIRTRTSFDHVELEVKDSGTGMDEATRARCMDPFFTTKGDRGTGLGLSMVYGIVKRHQGHLEIESALGAGSTFRLLLPLRGVQQAANGEILSQPRPRRALRILCVDDDVSIRTSLETVLKSDGHRVTLADSGASALALCEEGDCPFDAIITDLGMPHMDGREFASRVRKKWSSPPIILLTGWGSQLREQSEQWTIFADVLAKPPRLNELRAALAKAVN